MSVARLASCALLALALAFTPGCDGESARAVGDRPMSFAPSGADDGPADGASIVLRDRHPNQLALNRVIVDVVAHGAADLHGAAFRVTWDPEALAFDDAQSGTVWSKQVFSLAKEGSPGKLAVVWSEKGETGVDATDETVIGTLTFRVKRVRSTPLSFMNERSQIVDKRGELLTARWRGGVVSAH